MSDEQRAEYRAQGALANLVADMSYKMEREGRSQEYQDSFWRALDEEMRKGL